MLSKRTGPAQSIGEYRRSEKVGCCFVFSAFLTVVEATALQEPRKARKEKESFEIDFFTADVPDIDTLFNPGGSTITLSKSRWKSASRNLLPDDIHFNSRQLITLFLKPKGRFLQKLSAGKQHPVGEVQAYDMDEKFWAEANEGKEHAHAFSGLLLRIFCRANSTRRAASDIYL
jgi:hypothetical protein